jgi:transcriptional regulator with XRE-family HTH domain
MPIDKITPIDIHIAEKLRQFRLIHGMSQDKLGELVGVTFQQIQKYEKAKNRISASRLFEFAQFLEQPIGAFFEGMKADRMYYNYEFKSDKNQRQKAEEFSKEILPLTRAFNRIESEEAKKHLIGLTIAISRSKIKKIKHAYS